jgi:hypothetical protein
MRTGKVFALWLFTAISASSITAQSLFLGNYQADATAKISTGTSIPQASSSGDITFYVLPVNWVRFRAQASFSITISRILPPTEPDHRRNRS